MKYSHLDLIEFAGEKKNLLEEYGLLKNSHNIKLELEDGSELNVDYTINNPTCPDEDGLFSASMDGSSGIYSVYFDEQFDDPWHLASIDYSRQTKIGSIVARVNYANRFNNNALQFEVDAYPSISETFYAYVNAGFSDDAGIFPEYRAGFSLYANLPWALEAEAGFRLLGFDDQTWIYTASIGKYYKSFWFNFRTFLTPSNSSVSQSYSFMTRYYLGGADDFLSLRVGTGLSPDNQTNNILYNNGNQYRLKSDNIAIGYRKTLWSTNVLFIETGIQNQEYRQGEKGNQFTIGVGYLKRF